MICRKNWANEYIIGGVQPVFDMEKEEYIMTGKEIIDTLTDEQAYSLLVKAQRYAATLPDTNRGHRRRMADTLVASLPMK